MAVERTRLVALVARVVSPVVGPGGKAISPTVAERRRLAALATAGWLLGRR
jgi:hypothetical protein